MSSRLGVTSQSIAGCRSLKLKMSSPADSMNIVAEITRPALEEALGLTGKQDALPRRLLDYWAFAVGFAQGGVMLYFGIRGVVGYSLGPDRDVVRFFFSLVIAAIPVAFAAWIARKELSRRRLLRSLLGHVTLSITASGIRGSAPGYPSQNWQWDELRGYRVGRHAIVCQSSKGPGFIVIPIGNLSSGDLAQVRAHLATHLPEMDSRQLREL
jgi:hypothetical protein